MIIEQVRKHKDTIKWFCDNPELGVWIRPAGNLSWILIYNPAFNLDTEYLENDSYIIYRKAQVEGKTIQFEECDGVWRDEILKSVPCGALRHYRVKPPEEIPIGALVRNVETGKIIRAISQMRENDSWKIWHPKRNEWCVFYERALGVPNTEDLFRIAKFKLTHEIGKVNGLHEDIFGNRHMYVAPVEALDMLISEST